MCESRVGEHICWHCLSGKLLLAVIWIQIFLHTQLLYKGDGAVSLLSALQTDSAVIHLSLCNLHITGSHKKCEVSTRFRESPYWGETESCPCQGSGCTIRADILSGWLYMNLQVCCFLPARNLKESTGYSWKREGMRKKTIHIRFVLRFRLLG